MNLADLVREGFGTDEELNCTEIILQGSNIAYDLGLDKEAMKLAAGFGSGMALEKTCGALTGAIMVLGILFKQEGEEGKERLKMLVIELFQRYEEKMGSTDCAPLKDMYRTEEEGCRIVILRAAEVLDELVRKNLT